MIHRSTRKIHRQRRDLLDAAESPHRLAGDERAASTCAVVWPPALACAAMRSRRLGDSTVPGQMALQRMPLVMKSAATALVRPITAALVLP